MKLSLSKEMQFQRKAKLIRQPGSRNLNGSFLIDMLHRKAAEMAMSSQEAIDHINLKPIVSAIARDPQLKPIVDFSFNRYAHPNHQPLGCPPLASQTLSIPDAPCGQVISCPREPRHKVWYRLLQWIGEIDI